MTLSRPIVKKKFTALVKKSNNIVITSHYSPDDDAIASSLVTYDWVVTKYPDKKINIIITGGKNTRYSTFFNYNKIKFVPDLSTELTDVDLLIMVDGSQYDRFSRQPEKIPNHSCKMVCFDHRRQQCSGVIDSIMKKFTAERYPGERHAYSLAPATFGTAMSFMGPNSDLSRRLNPDETPKQDSQCVNSADYNSYLHDLQYKHIKNDYLKNPTPENKKQQMKRIWKADDQFINAMDQDTEEPMAPIAGKLIQIKETGEKLGLPTTFSGFGKKEESENSDPCYRLRSLVKEQYKNEAKQENKKKVQKGGFLIPLIPLATTALSALIAKAVPDIYDFIKSKISGSGYKMNHKTLKDKKLFLKDFANQL